MSKILLVEDDEMLLEMYNLRFKEGGFEITIAKDGEQGLELARKIIPDIILLDVMMPKMDGFAVLAELKKDIKTQKIPVLLLTNLGQQEDMDKGKSLGAADYIVKANLTPVQVLDKVKTYLKK